MDNNDILDKLHNRVRAINETLFEWGSDLNAETLLSLEIERHGLRLQINDMQPPMPPLVLDDDMPF